MAIALVVAGTLTGCETEGGAVAANGQGPKHDAGTIAAADAAGQGEVGHAGAAPDAADGAAVAADGVGATDGVSAADGVTATDSANTDDSVAAADSAGTDGPSAGSDSADASQPLCPGPAKPPLSLDAGTGPIPDFDNCDFPPPAFFKGAPPPPKTLGIEVGRVSQWGIFTPYVENDWVAIEHGNQGSFHTFVSFRTMVPGATVAKLKTQADVQLYDGCKSIAYSTAPVLYPSHKGGSVYFLSGGVAGAALLYLDDNKLGIKSSQSKDFCNKWYMLRMAVRDMKSGAWGETSIVVRTYEIPPVSKK